MSIISTLREFSDDEPVLLGAAVKLAVLLAAGIVIVALDLNAVAVAAAVAVVAGVDVGVTKQQRDNAIPLPKMRKHPDSRQADPDEQHAP